jgi:DNA-binding response OmpR family regulator
MKYNFLKKGFRFFWKTGKKVIHKITGIVSYQIGNVTFDRVTRTTHYQQEKRRCDQQTCILLNAFMEAEGYFLSCEEIDALMGWNKEKEMGVDLRRSKAISRVREALFCDKKSGLKIEACENEQKNKGFRLSW